MKTLSILLLVLIAGCKDEGSQLQQARLDSALVEDGRLQERIVWQRWLKKKTDETNDIIKNRMVEFNSAKSSADQAQILKDILFQVATIHAKGYPYKGF